MKCCIVHTMYYPYKAGGAELTVQQIAEGFVRYGHEVVVVSTGKRNDLRYHNGVKIYEIKIKNLYWPFDFFYGKTLMKPLWHMLDTYNPLMANQLGSILDLERPDYVMVHNLAGISVSAWQAAKKRGLPVVQVLHDYYNLCVRSTMFNNDRNCLKQCPICRLYRFPNKFNSNQVDVVVGVSNYILKAHTSFGLFPNARKMVIYNGYSLNHNVNPGRINEKVRFGYIGRLHPTKGLDLLINAFLTLGAPNTELIIAGEGSPEYVNRLHQLVCDKPVHFLGHTSQDVFFPQIDILVVPSKWDEPFGKVVIEAMSWGKPLIASIRGGIPEIVIDNETGLLFDPNDLGALVYSMQEMINRRDEYTRMSSVCIEHAKQFSEDKMIEKYNAIYNILF